MAELADAPDLGSGVPDVQVQVLLPAPNREHPAASRERPAARKVFTEIREFFLYNL